MRAADAFFGHHGELLCDGCASEQKVLAPAFEGALRDQGQDDGWLSLRLVLFGVKLLLVFGYLLMRL